MSPKTSTRSLPRTVRRPFRPVLALCLVALATVLSSCGVPVADNPSAITHVPFGLLAKPTASTPVTQTTSPPPAGDQAIVVYFVAPSGHLAPVQRVTSEPVDLTVVLQSLVNGPTTSEAAAGLQDEVPTQTRILGPGTVAGGVATVDLSAAFGQLAGQAQIEAIAQVVFTVTADVSGVAAVAFEVAGQLTQVPESNGALVNPATRAEFASLAPA